MPLDRVKLLYTSLISTLTRLRDILLDMNPDTLLPWGTIFANHHNVRVLCDLCGLTWDEKQEMTATVWGESGFDNNAICLNLSDGTFRSTSYQLIDVDIEDLNEKGLTVTSIDAGLCQWNDKYHGNEIDTFHAVNDSERAVRLMCSYWIAARNNPAIKDEWVAHKNGRYKIMLGRV